MKLLSLVSGYKTHLIVTGIVFNAILPFLIGDISLREVDFVVILEALGLSALRAGVAKS